VLSFIFEVNEMICFNRDLKLKTFFKKSDLDGFVKSSNSPAKKQRDKKGVQILES